MNLTCAEPTNPTGFRIIFQGLQPGVVIREAGSNGAIKENRYLGDGCKCARAFGIMQLKAGGWIASKRLKKAIKMTEDVLDGMPQSSNIKLEG